jgi:arsenate reductase (thioredoxin)
MKTYNILFLCTHNSARSILGEALASTHPSGKFVGYSAGSTPGTSVNPIAADIAVELGMDRTLLKSKSWDVYAGPNAPKMDFIITVCDNAAGEVCPFWPGQPATAHWGFPDPSQVQGTDLEKRAAFNTVMNGLKKRIDLLASMPLEKLDSMTLKSIHASA